MGTVDLSCTAGTDAGRFGETATATLHAAELDAAIRATMPPE